MNTLEGTHFTLPREAWRKPISLAQRTFDGTLDGTLDGTHFTRPGNLGGNPSWDPFHSPWEA
jgi:hypothetical protein